MVASGGVPAPRRERLHEGAQPALDGYFSQVARAFDAVAPDYDATFVPDGSVMAVLRQRSLAVLLRTLPQGGRVLDVGCGTGAEAVALAQSERTVIATDISEGMLAQTRRRAQEAGVAGRMQFVQRAAHDLAGLAEDPALHPLAGAYSSFGALNCEPDLGLVACGLAALLPPGAPLVLSVMNRWCLWEIAWYLLHGQPGRATRRLRSPAGPHYPPGPLPLPRLALSAAEGLGEEGGTAPHAAGVGEGKTSMAPLALGHLPVWYVTPGSLARQLHPWFAMEWTGALAVALPPPALDPWLARRPLLRQALSWLDDCLWDRRPFSWWGDHVIMTLRRTAIPVPPSPCKRGVA